MGISKEERLRLLHENDTYGYWKFINIDTEYINLEDCTVKCLKCGEVSPHYKNANAIFKGKSSMCRKCAAKERGSNTIERTKERYKKGSIFGCLKVINIDTEFVSSSDCTVQCTKCGSIFSHYSLTSNKAPIRCRECNSNSRLVGKIFISKDNVEFECIGYSNNTYTLKDLSNNFERTVASNSLKDLTDIKFYSGKKTLEDYNNLYLNKVITSKDGVKVKVKEIYRGDDKRIFATLENIESGEIISRNLRNVDSKGFTYNHVHNRMADVGSVCTTKDGYTVKVLENKSNYSKLEFLDGSIAGFKTPFYEDFSKCSYSHPSLNRHKYGRYFSYSIEGIAFRLDDPKDVYYNCKKEGSDEYEILRPCDIEEQGWDTYYDYTIYGKVLDLSNKEDIYYKCQKKGSDKIEVLRLCDIKERQGGL